MKSAGVDMYEGRGVIAGPNTVQVQMVDGSVKTLRAKNILVATGARHYGSRVPLPNYLYNVLCF